MNTKALLGAVGALILAAAPAIANAERVYFLVGTRHVYRIGADPYLMVAERQKIEQDYADQVAADRDIFNKALDGGADPAVERPDFENALDDLAKERDDKLGAIFDREDYERDRHPELRIDGDGPYQVMGINFHMRANVEVFENFVVMAPWPGYIVVGHPYGWAFGVVYNPFEFRHVYTVWHQSYIAIGRPAFVGFVGHAGPIRIEGIMRGPRGEWIQQRAPIGKYEHGANPPRFDGNRDRGGPGHDRDPKRVTRYNSGKPRSGDEPRKHDGGY